MSQSERLLCSRPPNSGVVTSTGREWTRGYENAAKNWDNRRKGDSSTVPMRIINHMMILSNTEDDDGIEGLASTVQVRALGGGLWEATDINSWGKYFGMGRERDIHGRTVTVSPASDMMAYFQNMSFCQLNTSDAYYEKDNTERNAKMLLPTHKVFLQHHPQFSHGLQRNVLIHENMFEEEADAIRLIGGSGIQQKYDKENQIQYKVTIKKKSKKKVVKKCKSATQVAKVVNGGKSHTGFQLYVSSKVYKTFVESLGDSSRMPVVLRWPMGHPGDYVKQDATLKQDLPKMKTDYYKIECFIPSA